MTKELSNGLVYLCTELLWQSSKLKNFQANNYKIDSKTPFENNLLLKINFFFNFLIVITGNESLCRLI
jgi:hypothetical protein